MTNPEKKVEKSICGDYCDQQQNYGDGDGENFWDTFELLEIDGNDERSSEQVTGNENWCSVSKVAFSHSCQKQIGVILMWFHVVNLSVSQGSYFTLKKGLKVLLTMALFKGILVDM